MHKTPLKMGILGCGSFAQRRILPELRDLDTVQIIALQKRNLDEAKKIANQWHIPHGVATRDELLSNPEIEAIFIATPNHLHEEDAIACAKAGKHVLCEKPLAPTVAAIEWMLAAFQKTTLSVGQSIRFKGCVQKARSLLESGELGELLSFKAHFAIPVPQSNWRHRRDMGGGVLQDMGVHLIDLIRFISQQEILSIYAIANETSDAEDTVTALCHLEGGATASFECSFVQPYATGFEVIGTKSRLISTHSLRQTYDPVETLCHALKDETKIYLPVKAGNVYLEELRHYAQAIKGEVPSILPAEEGLKNQRVIEAAYESIKKKSVSFLQQL